jgi:hypothetical protein
MLALLALLALLAGFLNSALSQGSMVSFIYLIKY